MRMLKFGTNDDLLKKKQRMQKFGQEFKEYGIKVIQSIGFLIVHRRGRTR